MIALPDTIFSAPPPHLQITVLNELPASCCDRYSLTRILLNKTALWSEIPLSTDTFSGWHSGN